MSKFYVNKVVNSIIFFFLLTLIFCSSCFAELNITVIDVGQGNAVYLEDNKGNVLIDGGKKMYDVSDYLRNKGVKKIDLVIATHAHADHIGGLVGVLKRINVDKILYNGQTHTTQTFERFVDLILDSEINYIEPKMKDVFEVGDMKVQILHPLSSASKHTGHLHTQNIASRIKYDNFSIIVAGDLEKEGELVILDFDIPVKSQILELGHHGSRTSTSEEWLKTVGPELAFYQAGEGNSYGHPHSETISLLKRNGVKVIGTDTHGDIVITAQKDGSFSVESSKDTGQFGLQDEANSEAPSASSDCIDLNTASLNELDNIIHIGDDRAEAVVQGRPWDNVWDLTRIHGIGQARIEDIKEQGLVCE